jgi:hypothetical protein
MGEIGEIGDRHRTQSGSATGNPTAGRGDKIWRHMAVVFWWNHDTGDSSSRPIERPPGPRPGDRSPSAPQRTAAPPEPVARPHPKLAKAASLAALRPHPKVAKNGRLTGISLTLSGECGHFSPLRSAPWPGEALARARSAHRSEGRHKLSLCGSAQVVGERIRRTRVSATRVGLRCSLLLRVGSRGRRSRSFVAT